MDILISSREKDASSILEAVKTYFSEEFSDKAFVWKRTGAMISTSLDIGEKEVVHAFEELVKEYPGLHVEAFYSYDVREEDSSAQWWGTTKIYSEKENGETKISSSSSTYWN